LHVNPAAGSRGETLSDRQARKHRLFSYPRSA
jgi:hypothetical protein